jgi:GT2 family glycosyltransferase
VPKADADFSVAVCTRERPDRLAATLAALDRQSRRDFDLVVVDQSAVPDPTLERREREDARTRVIRDAGGSGLSRARNLAWRATRTDWLVFLDDDCVPEPGWAEALHAELATAREAELVSGHVGGRQPAGGDYLPVTIFPVDRPALVRGGRVHPGKVGFGVSFAVRRRAVERLGGWDERLGPGARDFPAADDMDFNYRLLRSGGVAYLTPSVRASHEQWRRPGELPSLHEGYLAAWCGFAMKTLRTGDVRGGLWLWAIAVVDVLDMLASAVHQRSGLRLRVALAKLRGLARGTVLGAARRW